MHNSWRRIGATQTLRELQEVKNAETNRLNDMVVRDREALLEKLAGCQAQSTIEDRDLAEQLMQRIQITYGHVVDDDVKCWHLLDSKSLKTLGSVGKGVDKVEWRGEHFALKTFFGLEQQSFKNEVSILAGLSHPNIVSLVGFIINTRNGGSSILLELMDQDLFYYMKEKLANDDSDGVPFSHIEATDIMLQIAEGVQYLHENRIVHRDLKSFNIMINRVRRGGGAQEHLQVKVADFGHSKLKHNSHTYSNQTPNIGTTRWMAPELFCRNSTTGSLQSADHMEIPEARHPFKTDVYSFAMVCVEILTGDVPFASNVALGGLRESIVDGLRPELPWSRWPERLCSLIKKCWVFDPVERPSFATIVSELKCIKWSLALGTDLTFLV
jgi:serine/threonine protein kinase